VSAHDRFADDVGAYLLGALEPGEVRRFEKHLKRCGDCRREVARLEVARDALPASVEQHSPAPELKLTLMETVRAEAAERAPVAAPTRAGRSRWRDVLLARPRLAAVAAAVMVAIGVAAGALVGATGGGRQDAHTVAATVDASRMPAARASLVVPADADTKGGAILRVQGMQAPQAGHVYEVWIKRGDKVTPSSLFTVGRDGSGAAAIPNRLRDADAVLVTREPEGGSRQPSEPSLVTVPLSS
jgi:anti-sigma-K factor RskA